MKKFILPPFPEILSFEKSQNKNSSKKPNFDYKMLCGNSKRRKDQKSMQKKAERPNKIKRKEDD